MRTTMIINDELYRQVKERARAEDRTVTSFVEEALRASLAGIDRRAGAVDVYLLPPSGTPGARPLIDVTDKEALAALLDEDDFTMQQILRAQSAVQ